MLKEKFYQQNGFYQALLIFILILAINILTNQYKTLFVAETGKFKVLGGIWVIIALGLVLKWKYCYRILSVFILFLLTLVTILAITMFVMDNEHLLSYIGLILILLLITYLLFYSSANKYYFNKE